MATIVAFHAHPDDEAISTGGTLAKAAETGHRVVIVWATRGEHGEFPDGFLDDGEELWQRRTPEAEASARILGAARAEFLGYRDSGMMGTPENDAPEAFWQADVDVAAERLAAILREEGADVLTVYDEHGVYGHPDHIQVHRVGIRAAALAGTPRVYEATADRDQIHRRMNEMREAGVDLPGGLARELPEFGSPAAMITTQVDVLAVLDRKRAAMAAHASQITSDSWFMQLPPNVFADTFGTEWFIRRGEPPPATEHDLFDGL